MGKTTNGEFKDSPTICIEIKAKQGYLMDDDDVNGVMKCRYCYFQVKLKLGFGENFWEFALIEWRTNFNACVERPENEATNYSWQETFN